MAQRSHVEFGNWDDGEDIAYTAYFDNATRAKADRLNEPSVSDTSRPNNEQHKFREGFFPRRSPLHCDAVKSPSRVYDGLKSVKSIAEEASRSKQRRKLSSEDGNMKNYPVSPLHHQTPGRISSGSPLHQHQGNNISHSNERTIRRSTNSDHSIQKSPLHPRTEVKSAIVASPSWERKGSSHGGGRHRLAPSTPGRSHRPSITRGNETGDDHGTSVPKFGDWDESNPVSSVNYTDIFTQVRRERRNGEDSFPGSTNGASHSNDRHRSGVVNSKGCGCFPWRK